MENCAVLSGVREFLFVCFTLMSDSSKIKQKIIKVFSPTDPQLDSLKNNFKFALTLTLKCSYMFWCEKHHPQGAHYLNLAKVTIVKMS